MEKSSRMDRVFNRLVQGLTALSRHLDFAWSPAYGYLNSCPTNIGTGMRASVHIRLEHLCQHHHVLSSLAQQHHLQIRGTQGEKTGIENNVLDISNRYRFGLCEKEILKTLHKGVSALIAAEKMIQLIPLKKGAKQ